MYIAWTSYDPQIVDSYFDTREVELAEWERALVRFADWFFMLLERSDLGVFGIIVSVLVHLQLYTMLLLL